MVIHITGIDGFIGGHLRTSLELTGHSVIGSGRACALLPWEALGFGLPDVVVHCGAVGKHKSAEHTIILNVVSTAVWARHCSEVGIPFIYVNTYERPRTSLYALSKDMGSQANRFYCDPFREVVLGPVYGLGSRSAPTLFLLGARSGDEPLQAVDGEARCYLHVSDVVWALRKLIEDPDWSGRAYITRNDDSWAIKGIARLCCEMFGRNPDDYVEIHPRQDDHPAPTWLPWQWWTERPPITLLEGLTRDKLALDGV